MVVYKDLLVLFGGWSHPTPYPLHQVGSSHHLRRGVLTNAANITFKQPFFQCIIDYDIDTSLICALNLLCANKLRIAVSEMVK